MREAGLTIKRRIGGKGTNCVLGNSLGRNRGSSRKHFLKLCFDPIIPAEQNHYNREFLNFFWAFLAGVFSINIESYELSCKRVVQFVNGYSKPH